MKEKSTSPFVMELISVCFLYVCDYPWEFDIKYMSISSYFQGFGVFKFVEPGSYKVSWRLSLARTVNLHGNIIFTVHVDCENSEQNEHNTVSCTINQQYVRAVVYGTC